MSARIIIIESMTFQFLMLASDAVGQQWQTTYASTRTRVTRGAAIKSPFDHGRHHYRTGECFIGRSKYISDTTSQAYSVSWNNSQYVFTHHLSARPEGRQPRLTRLLWEDSRPPARPAIGCRPPCPFSLSQLAIAKTCCRRAARAGQWQDDQCGQLVCNTV